MFQVGAAIKLLRCFPPNSQAACGAAQGLCTIVGNSAHLTPGPALKERLKSSYYSLAARHPVQTDWTQASFLGAWEWIKKGTDRKVQEWKTVGVVLDDILELVQRARNGGEKKLNRCVHCHDNGIFAVARNCKLHV